MASPGGGERVNNDLRKGWSFGGRKDTRENEVGWGLERFIRDSGGTCGDRLFV